MTADFMLNLAADEIERLRAEVSRLGSFLHPVGTISAARPAKPMPACDEWTLPIFATTNRHLCDGCSGEKYDHTYEWVPAVTPFGGSRRPWSVEQINEWHDSGLITPEHRDLLLAATRAFDESKAVQND